MHFLIQFLETRPICPCRPLRDLDLGYKLGCSNTGFNLNLSDKPGNSGAFFTSYWKLISTGSAALFISGCWQVLEEELLLLIL